MMFGQAVQKQRGSASFTWQALDLGGGGKGGQEQTTAVQFQVEPAWNASTLSSHPSGLDPPPEPYLPLGEHGV